MTTIEYQAPARDLGGDYLTGHRDGFNRAAGQAIPGAQRQPSPSYALGFNHGAFAYGEAYRETLVPVPGHHIEERAVVYLRLSDDGTSWEIDSPTSDGYPLEGYEDGPLSEACECDDPDECGRAREYAETVRLPDAEQLLRLLADHLGFTLT